MLHMLTIIYGHLRNECIYYGYPDYNLKSILSQFEFANQYVLFFSTKYVYPHVSVDIDFAVIESHELNEQCACTYWQFHFSHQNCKDRRNGNIHIILFNIMRYTSATTESALGNIFINWKSYKRRKLSKRELCMRNNVAVTCTYLLQLFYQ